MSRHGYSDDLDHWALIRYRGQVASAIRGKRGQRLLRDLAEAMDAMPRKRLIAGELIRPDGDVCALGAVGLRRGVPMGGLDVEDFEIVAGMFDIAEPLAREVMFMNDESWSNTPEARWHHIRSWVAENLKASDDGKS